ncbi:hypothetical protein N7475_005024 [Penicillium sp. IBT 31633x]|nr:hypothetical protein N7475_005024 [Penicillium sp. IBT 31633x]
MDDLPPPAVIAAFFIAWREANSLDTRSPATPPLLSASSLTRPLSTTPTPAQLTCPPFSDTVSATLLAYHHREQRQRAVEPDISIAVRLPGTVEFTPLITDKFYFAAYMTKRAGKMLNPSWIGGLKAEYDGTVKEFLKNIPGRTPRLHVVVARHERTVDSGPDHRLVVKPDPMDASPAVDSCSAVEAINQIKASSASGNWATPEPAKTKT